MIMKYKKISVAILFATILIGCNKDNEVVETIDPLINVPILITTNAEYNDPLREFGISLTNENNSEYTYLNNKLTLDSSGVAWKPETQMQWESSNANVDIVAYYPYQYNLDTTTNIIIDQSVRFDQSTLEGIKASDFLYYSKKNVVPNKSGIALPFTHALSKINIKINLDSELNNDIEIDQNPISNVNFFCAKALFNWNLNTNTIIPQGIITPVTPFEAPYFAGNGTTDAVASYKAILVSQLIPASSFIVEFNINGTQYSWASTKDISLLQNRAYILNLIITADKKVTATEDISEVNWSMN